MSSSSPEPPTPLYKSPYVLTPLLLLLTLLTALAAIHLAGYSDDVAKYMAKRFFRAKAEAEKAALAKVGGEKAEGFL